MKKPLGVYTFLILFLGGLGEREEDTEPTLVKALTATCGKDGIKVNVRFSIPFTGIVYSNGHYDTPGCVFINQNTSVTLGTKFSFLIPPDECGTIFRDPGSVLSKDLSGNNHNEVFMENTVMFQRNHYIQEQGDLAQTLRCVWQKEIRKPLYATLPLSGKPQPHRPVHGSLDLTSRRKVTQQNIQFPSASQPVHSLVKGLQGKGQVESVPYGRRSGRSFEHLTTNAQQSSRSSKMAFTNSTALAFKSEGRGHQGAITMNSSSASSSMPCYMHYVVGLVCLNLFLSRNVR